LVFFVLNARAKRCSNGRHRHENSPAPIGLLITDPSARVSFWCRSNDVGGQRPRHYPIVPVHRTIILRENGCSIFSIFNDLSRIYCPFHDSIPERILMIDSAASNTILMSPFCNSAVSFQESDGEAGPVCSTRAAFCYCGLMDLQFEIAWNCINRLFALAPPSSGSSLWCSRMLSHWGFLIHPMV